MGATIRSITAREILAERGLLGLEVTVLADDGAVGVATPESGVSTGRNEAAFVLDGEPRYGGTGVRRAVDAITQIIAPALAGHGRLPTSSRVDRAMIELDGTPNKRRLGANAIVGVSLAVLKAAASSADLPLYRYIGGANACIAPDPDRLHQLRRALPRPRHLALVQADLRVRRLRRGLLLGGLEMSLDVAEQCQRPFPRALRRPVRAHLLLRRTWPASIDDDRELLDVMTESIASCGYEGKMGIYFDCAADSTTSRDDRPLRRLLLAGREVARRPAPATTRRRDRNYPIALHRGPAPRGGLRGHRPRSRGRRASRSWATTSSRPTLERSAQGIEAGRGELDGAEDHARWAR